MHKVSVQTGDWYDELFGIDENPDAAFRFIKDCGFDAVDYNLDHTLSPTQIRAHIKVPFYEKTRQELLAYFCPVKEAAQKAGVSFGQIHAPFPSYVENDPDYNAYLVHAFGELLHVSAYLDCPALVVHPIVNKDKTREWELNMQMYPKLIPVAKETGVKICLENLPAFPGNPVDSGVCGSAEEACRYLDALNAMAGEAVFGFCLDVGHANIAGGNLRQMINELGHRLTILHIHDNDGVVDRHQIPYSFKNKEKTVPNVDWEGLLAGLRDIGYEGELNLETYGALKAMPQELYEPTLRYLGAIGKYFQTRLA